MHTCLIYQTYNRAIITFYKRYKVLIEGIAAKIPVLVSNNEGPKEIIQNGGFVYYFEVGNPDDWAKNIFKVMTEYASGDVRQKTNLAYTYAKEHFDIRRTAAEYVSQYQGLVS